MDLFHSLGNKIRQVPHDESGSVLLLSGMMTFLIAIMAIYAVDTSQVIYNRITSQNAADAASETAALWQARGLNMEQEINFFHYFFNQSVFVAEWSHLVACYKTGPDYTDFIECIFPPACAAAIAQLRSDCDSCKKALSDNQYQADKSESILNLQSTLSYIFPLLEVAFASQAAQQSGADPILNVTANYLGNAFSILPSPLNNLSGINLPSLPSGLSSFNLYAMPINPTSVSFNIVQKQGGYWPWKWTFVGPQLGSFDQYLMKAGAVFGWGIACAGCWVVGDEPDLSGLLPSSWGWSDSYYIGHPGYMTWVAGKTNETELAGLGNIRWLNPNPSPPAEISYWMNQSNLPMYTKSFTSSSSLPIPAVIGLATSQVEGMGVTAVDESMVSQFESVIDNLSSLGNNSGGSVASSLSSIANGLGEFFGWIPLDSTPRLTEVYLPPNGIAGTTIFLYH
jgi:hypothetical protein